jgi:ATP-dependent DNA helicase RecQ
MLLAPDDPDFGQELPRLLERLNRIGIDQVVAPAEVAPSAAAILADLDAPLGLVLEAEAWRSDVKPARRHCAVLLPHGDILASHVLHALSAHASAWPELTWLVVCRPDRQLGGRRLDQTLSPGAPLPEAVLDSLDAGVAA